MKFLLKVLIVLTLAVAVALLAHHDPGYILINYGQWSLETSVALSVIVILLIFFSLYFLLRLLSNTFRLPKRLRLWRQQRLKIKSSQSMTKGLVYLAEGNWSAAEKKLLRYISHSDNTMLNYIAAARAAEKQNARERRDNYLQMAYESMPEDHLAVSLTQAELQISSGQLEQALATLTKLHSTMPAHEMVLKLLMRLYTELHDWERLIELLPSLRKRSILFEREAEDMELQAHSALLNRAACENGVQALNDAWRRVPKNIKQHDMLLLLYVRHLISKDASTQAENILYHAIKNKWKDEYIYLYGLTSSNDVSNQLSRAEKWLKVHDNNPVLLLTLGRLSLRNNLWGKARTYLEKSIKIDARAETCNELATLLEQLGENETALEYYRRGLAISTNTPTQIGHKQETSKNEQGLLIPC